MMPTSCPSLEGQVHHSAQRHPQERVQNATTRMWSALLHHMGPLTRMLATMTSSIFAEVQSVPHHL